MTFTADPLSREKLTSLRDQILALRQRAIDLESLAKDEIALVHPERRTGARNLVDYLSLRQFDIRGLQQGLHQCGLSSFGIVQRNVLASLSTVIRVLDRLCNLESGIADSPEHPTMADDRKQLERFNNDTLGNATLGGIRIMVTMPPEAADDPSVIESLLEQGMTIMRVNCAHDNPAAWEEMVHHLDTARTKLGKECRIAFDLAGPKLRTGPIQPGPEVRRFKPLRDSLGNAVTPARIVFGCGDDGQPVPINTFLVEMARIGDVISLKDTRGRARRLEVVAVDKQSFSCTSDHTTYLTTGTRINLLRAGQKIASATIGRLPATEGAISLSPGESVIITRDLAPGRSALLDEAQLEILEPARIGCTLSEVFDCIAVGHRVLLDDGKFEGVVREVQDNEFRVEIRRAGTGKAPLKAEKGVNLPDTPLQLPALTSKDIEDLEFVVRHADLVSFSFVRRPQDIEDLYGHLKRLNADDIGVVLKIENRAGFAALPELLMAAAKRKRIAVMVARGDLGVEVGFERLAEVQEEILWLCEAAQVPVIWATQVLESLAKNGLPSRGEVTDAAMSVRAECVMLNKGPYIANAIGFLTDVSQRMHQHASKTFTTHRALSVAETAWLESGRSASTTGP
jgi:pyruvate kinase